MIVNFDNLDFPSVTFCNLNPIRRSEMLELAEEKPDVEELKDFLDQFKPPKDYRIDRPPRVTTATTTRSSTSTNEGLSTVSTTTTGKCDIKDIHRLRVVPIKDRHRLRVVRIKETQTEGVSIGVVPIKNPGGLT